MNFYFFPPSAVGDFNPFGSVITTFSVGGPTTNCIDFNITDDEELEGNHNFTVEITDISSMPPHAIIGTLNTTVVTITDNESKYFTVHVKEVSKACVPDIYNNKLNLN